MSAIITWDDVEALAPDLASVDDAAQALILAHVALQVGSGNWGTMQAMGQVYLAAHLGALVLARATGLGSPTSITVGPASRSFTSIASSGVSLQSTTWGKEYDRVRRLLPCRFGLVV